MAVLFSHWFLANSYDAIIQRLYKGTNTENRCMIGAKTWTYGFVQNDLFTQSFAISDRSWRKWDPY